MSLGRRAPIVLSLAIALVSASAPTAGAAELTAECEVGNAAGSAVDRATTPSKGAAPGKKPKKKKPGKKKPGTKKEITLQPDAQSANKVVNLGADRDEKKVTLHVNVSPEVAEGFEKKLELVAEPFANDSTTGETVTFPEPTFSELHLSKSGKRIIFTMCIVPPDDLPAGKYVSVVRMEGPAPVKEATMTVTLNGKDGNGFIIGFFITLVLSFFILLYKGAAERRPLMLKAAEKKTGTDRDKAIREAEGWWAPIESCVRDLGWLVPTLALLGAAFAILYAVYDKNPAWGEGGLVNSVIALIGTGLAAVGAKTVLTPTPADRTTPL